MVIKKNDFIEIDYVGRIKGSDNIFDLTEEDLAKKKNIYNPNIKYKPKIICVGNGDVVNGLDKSFLGKREGEKYKVELENPFGDKDPSLIKIVPFEKFRKENINPFPGLQINADGMLAVVRSVAGGRVTLDFNHPLAGKDIIYEVSINKIVKNTLTKLTGLVENLLGDSFKVEGEGDNFKIESKYEIPNPIKDKFNEMVKELMPNIKLEFIVAK